MAKIIAGNWKMNGSKNDIETWFKDFYNADKGNKNLPTILISLPSIYIQYCKEVAKNYKGIEVNIGVEDCHQELKGAFTGNISATMLKDFDVKYSIIGHSERRQYEKETNEIVNKKAKTCVENGIIPLFRYSCKVLREILRHFANSASVKYLCPLNMESLLFIISSIFCVALCNLQYNAVIRSSFSVITLFITSSAFQYILVYLVSYNRFSFPIVRKEFA